MTILISNIPSYLPLAYTDPSKPKDFYSIHVLHQDASALAAVSYQIPCTHSSSPPINGDLYLQNHLLGIH